MRELFEKQRKFNDLVIENLCKKSGMDITHKQLINKDLLAVTVEVGEFIAEKDHELKKLEYADILIFLMNCGLSLGIEKCMTKKNIVILYVQAERTMYVDAILNFSVRFSEFANCVQSFKYWKINKTPKKEVEKNYLECFIALFRIAKTMGYTVEDIKAAYETKNQENYRRQEGGY